MEDNIDFPIVQDNSLKKPKKKINKYKNKNIDN